MNDTKIEQEIQAKGLTAPRVTLGDLENNIVDTEIVKHISKSGQVLRWAVLTTRNGFAVAGKPSCAASSENDNAALGEQLAIDNARNELWPLMGYELRSKLAESKKRTQYTASDVVSWATVPMESGREYVFSDGTRVKLTKEEVLSVIDLGHPWRDESINAALAKHNKATGGKLARSAE